MPNALLQRRRFSPLRGLVRLLDLALLVAVLVLLYTVTIGIPETLVRRALRPSEAHGFAVETGRVRVRLFNGLVADDVRISRRQYTGPALAEVRRMALRVNALAAVRGRPWLTGVTLEEGLLRPRAMGPGMGRGTWSGALALQLKGVDIEGVLVESLGGDLSMGGDGWRLEGGTVTLRHGERHLSGSGRLACDAAGVLEGQGAAEGDPAVLNPLLSALGADVGRRIIDRFGFGAVAPRAAWSFRAPADPRDRKDVRLDLTLADLTYHGIAAARAEGVVALQWRPGVFTADIRPLLAVREEGEARGGLTFTSDGEVRTLAFDVVSAFDPIVAADLAGVWTNEVRERYRFEGPYRMAAQGRMNLTGPSELELVADLSFGRLIYGAHDLRNCRFAYRRSGATNRIDDLAATWFGGQLAGRAEWRRAAGADQAAPYRAAFTVERANFAEVAPTLLKIKQSEYSGRMSGRLELEGYTGDASYGSLRGGGALSISQGHLFRLPIFGGLSTFLARTIPGLDLMISQTDMTAEFAITEGRIRTDDVRIEGDVLSLLGKGSCGLDGSLDVDVQLTFLKSHTLLAKILRVPTYLFSKLFEFRLSGTRAEPKWYPINFSKDLWQRRSAERNKEDGGVTNAPMIEWDEPW